MRGRELTYIRLVRSLCSYPLLEGKHKQTGKYSKYLGRDKAGRKRGSQSLKIHSRVLCLLPHVLVEYIPRVGGQPENVNVSTDSRLLGSYKHRAPRTQPTGLFWMHRVILFFHFFHLPTEGFHAGRCG